MLKTLKYGLTGLYLAAMPVSAQEPALIGISIPAATHGWTGGLNYHAERTIESMKAAFPAVDFAVVTSSSAQQQASDIEDLALRGIDALVILPFESDPLTDPVKRLKEQGIFITAVDRGLSEEGIADLYVAGDNQQYGRVAAEYFKEKFPEGAKIVAMRGIPTALDNTRVDAFTAALEGSNIEILDLKYANWNADRGFEVMQDYLQRFPEIDGVWAGDDDTALGAIAAIEQSRRENITVLGGCGMNTVIKMIMDGHPMVEANIFSPPTVIAPAIELVTMRYAMQTPIEGEYILASPLITAENAQSYYFPESPY